MQITLYNTATRQKQAFTPIDPGNVRMYVCGPTVYGEAHIGNARPVIVFDVLFRLLRHVYGQDHVTYARNITDVDDKINARAAEEGVSIGEITARTTAQFHADVAALGALPPTVEPRATDHIDDMVDMIERLIARGNAYVAEDHVLFHVPSMPSYGRLSQRSLEDMQAGARVEVAPYKRDPMDFVLWKPSRDGEPAWPSPARINVQGRPGWHIECSAMAARHLGETFDIHGGGIDLVFPHHENEIAQSCCAHHTDMMAAIWMHNGFVQVEGEKMSKSLGNFITLQDLLARDVFGNRSWHGRVLRFAMLATHYRQPLDWTAERLVQARATLTEFAELIEGAEAGDAAEAGAAVGTGGVRAGSEPSPEVLAALADDLNTPRAISILHALAKSARRDNPDKLQQLRASLAFLGLLEGQTAAEVAGPSTAIALAPEAIDAKIRERLDARARRDYATGDRIRDELAAMGVRLKDGKDPVTGAVITTWEPID
ncbi:MAG: cysteine--tRNA ligase [Hyphomicrobiaceae bacterium]